MTCCNFYYEIVFNCYQNKAESLLDAKKNILVTA